MKGAHICPEVPLIMLHWSECQKSICGRRVDTELRAAPPQERRRPEPCALGYAAPLSSQYHPWTEARPLGEMAWHSGRRDAGRIDLAGASVTSSVKWAYHLHTQGCSKGVRWHVGHPHARLREEATRHSLKPEEVSRWHTKGMCLNSSWRPPGESHKQWRPPAGWPAREKPAVSLPARLCGQNVCDAVGVCVSMLGKQARGNFNTSLTATS